MIAKKRIATGEPGSSILIPLAGAMLCVAAAGVQAGTYMFAGDSNGLDIVTHPSGYTGTGANQEVVVKVCINPADPHATDMETSVRNVVATYNARQATTGNLLFDADTNIPAGEVDFESVVLHEMGHCLGMAHPNAASESGLSGGDTNYTKATKGVDGVFNLDAGVDGVIGSSDDVRGDDVNLHWFRISNNNPFTLDSVVDSSTYSRDLGQLPNGHLFAANADRSVGVLLGVADTEAVMQQGTMNDEAQRTLAADDVATLGYAISGIDETASTADDYSIRLVYQGITSTDCDVNLQFDNSETGFAQCSVGGSFVATDHVVISSADIYFNDTANWFFNDVYTGPLFDDVPFDYWAYDFIQTLGSSGITSGCGGNNYCPEDPVTRAEMAVFLERGINGSEYTPPAASGTVFTDVPLSYWAAAWVEQLASDGITGGCGGSDYCPDDNVTRAQMSIFLLRSEHGSAYAPPAATGTLFDDVPVDYWAASWIEQLVSENITSGCDSSNYCPDSNVTRAQMAVFLVRTFNL
ncbi:S-layer homology domain-containing protein [Thiolapillus brandeum]|uniref:SLH domain-containing protein n=1 Tax=Thiolapillus brandeum TaxID=1076588 RepID=A0A7U6JJC4_9GAMM|nr:S-layer homology domain-containing protein [Thiolapillus brandeum]BAO45532.1 hypothetical protein TBH_C2626 [Thiolapillus brandeum]